MLQVFEPGVHDATQHFGLEAVSGNSRGAVASHIVGKIERLREDAEEALQGRRSPWNQPADNMIDDELMLANRKEPTDIHGAPPDTRIDSLVAQLKDLVP